jgi:ABC-type antimicrobial peptide transport system permease subunit
MGNLAAWGSSHAVDFLAARALANLPFRPESFFVFSLPIVGASIGLSVVFCVVGAYSPANHAARLDPAVVMGQA